MVRVMLQTRKIRVQLEDHHSDAATARNTCSEGRALRITLGSDSLHTGDRCCVSLKAQILSDGAGSMVPPRTAPEDHHGRNS